MTASNTSNTITIDDVAYVRADSVDVKPTVKQIVVLQRGWVVVGDTFVDGDQIIVTDAKVIRIWGTTSGLGQLALTGPTSKTVLDQAGTVRAHVMSVVLTLDVAPGVTF